MPNERSFLSGGNFSPFISASLKGISQVFLIENAITGLLIFLAFFLITWESWLCYPP